MAAKLEIKDLATNYQKESEQWKEERLLLIAGKARAEDERDKF